MALYDAGAGVTMRDDDGLKQAVRAPRWQRVVAGVLAAAGVAVLLQVFASDAIDSWVDAALALSATYGLYLFARFALTGALPAGMRRRTPH